MRKFVILGVLLLFVLGAAQVFAQDATTEPTPEATAPVLQEPQLRDPQLLQDTSLISGQPCGAPCWHGITPGKTLWTDALAILQQDPTFTNLVPQNDTQSAAKVATWDVVGGVTCCQIYSADGQTVSVLFIRTAPGMILGDVIGVQGEPTYALGTQYSDTQSILNLVYPDKSMVVYAFVAGSQGALSESSEIIGVLYVTPEDMTTTITTSDLYNWKGYQNYQAYSSDGPNFDVTPSAASTPEATTAP